MSIVRSHLTRVLHLAVLLTVVDQLLTSLIMERPLPGRGRPVAASSISTVSSTGSSSRKSAWSASAC